MKSQLFLSLAIAGLTCWAMPAQSRSLRVMSLDQCADQYVLSLVPDAVLALSPRADDEDSWNRSHVAGHRVLRPGLETALGFQPDVVVRYWGGDARLLGGLERRGVRVISIADSTDMAAVETEVIRIADELGQPQRGRALVQRMKQNLARAAGVGEGRTILYMTPGGYSGGKGTLIDALLTAAGFNNAISRPGFVPIGVETLVLSPPTLVVRGFYNLWRGNWRSTGRHPVVSKTVEGRVLTDLSPATLSCPAWFAADAALQLADAAR